MTKREIKFRCWNNWEQKYMPTGHLLPWTLGENENFIDNFPLEQYTGLKDANGVEIYEGDILRVENLSMDGEVITTWHTDVIWADGAFVINSNETKGSYDTYLFSATEYVEPLFGLVVIGNVHQNHELLGE